MQFNANSRAKNVILSSVAGVTEQIIQVIVKFVYRTVFLIFFSKEYLGINGLFTNILQLFSMAEMGIGATIVYRMYKPFREKNIEEISALLFFYKRIYHIICCLIIIIGICFYPFLDIIIGDNEVPQDINITIVYFLFVLQSASSYLFVYKQSLLIADQKNYVLSIFSSSLNVIINVLQIILLFVMHDYTVVLASGIFMTIVINAEFSVLIQNKYKDIFKVKKGLERNKKQEIFKDTMGLMCHKLGGTVVSSTDSIVLTKYVSLAAVGIYSNYSMIVLCLQSFISKIFGGITSSVGNYVLTATKEQIYKLYKKMLFVDLWLSSFSCVCLYVLLNPFILSWLGDTYLLDKTVVFVICLQYYIQISRIVSGAFVNSCGLFMKDKIRPLIESGINLFVSILLAKYYGIIGVFIGTVLSALLTYYWREPYLLFREVFPKKIFDYCKYIGIWWILTIVLCWILDEITNGIFMGWYGVVIRVILCGVVTNIVYIILFHKTAEYLYFKKIIIAKILKKKGYDKK